EVEEERAMGRNRQQRRGATAGELAACRLDVVSGMLASTLVMSFILLTTAATLHASGTTRIATAAQAADALRPLAGGAAYWLFTIGLIGTGMLGVPVLAGSCAYAIAEAAAFRGSLDNLPRQARRFYAVVGVAMLLGLLLDGFGLDPVPMLFWSAVLNGMLAPPLIVLVVLLTSDPKIMGTRVNPPLLRWLGWATAGIMATAAVALVVTAL